MSAKPWWVRTLQEGDRAEDLLQHIRHDLVGVVNVLESRFLYLIKEGVRGALNLDGIAEELSLLARDLRRCFRRMQEIQERRDLSFKTTRELEEIDRRCIWLFRRIRVQQAFLRKLSLETKFREMVSPDAFKVYQSLLDLDEEERQSFLSDDAKIRTLILEQQNQEHGVG